MNKNEIEIQVNKLITNIEYYAGPLGERQTDKIKKMMPIMIGGRHSQKDKINSACELFISLSPSEERTSLCEWAASACYNGFLSKAVYSKILIETHRGGRLGSLLSCYPLAKRISMFEQAEPEHLMSKSEYKHFVSLPNEFKIYRGGAGVTPNKLKHGMGWTTDINQAAWFAYRFCFENDTPVVIEAIVKKENIFGCFDYENEVIIRGGKVSKMKASEIDIKNASAKQVKQNKKQQDEMLSDLKKAA